MTAYMYYLTDGFELYASMFLTSEEVEVKNKEAAESTGGNMRWERATPQNASMPRTEFFRHYTQQDFQSPVAPIGA